MEDDQRKQDEDIRGLKSSLYTIEHDLNWRIKDIETSLARYLPLMDRLIQEYEIEKEVKARIIRHNRLYLTTTQRIAAVIIFVVAVLDFASKFIHIG